ncbi:ABC transporter ATP-binding protein [Thermicanus aegyptius]|uniref:ABC transporter ATP-binding protein n=1 Tax=Thermicanus aegyptius TaxID=94009 RepID=UPI000402E726|nr:ABC transporter ATP-binding protein [Thermicanus aegyptius]
MENVIQLEGLTKRYGEFTAVDHLDLSLKKGEIFGFLGPNGAGKSTTILMLLGLVEPTEGTAHVLGYNATREPLEVKRRVGYLPDNVGFYEEMTGLENLLFTAELNGLSRDEGERRANNLLTRVGLTEAQGKKAGTYSRGMRQRLGLADVLMKQPELIILDEPTLGIDPEGVRDFLALIQTLSKEEGITVLLSSHHLHQVQRICDRVGLFVRGRLIALGTVEELSRQLFPEEDSLLEVEIDQVEEEILEAIRKVEGVTQVEREGERLEIRCGRKSGGKILSYLLSTGKTIRHFQQKEFGLDEIYHRYFEGVQ